MSDIEHPFQPGTPVYVFANRTLPISDTVLKVHKSGNFTLTKEPTQQYRAHGPTKWNTKVEWSATATGARYGHCVLTTPENTAKYDEAVAKAAFAARWIACSNAFYNLGIERVTPEAIDHFEKGIALLKPETPRRSY